MDIYGSTFINKDEIFCVQKILRYNEVYYPTALLVKEFLFERQIAVLEYPPYLLHDFFIFQRWKFFRNIQNTGNGTDRIFGKWLPAMFPGTTEMLKWVFKVRRPRALQVRNSAWYVCSCIFIWVYAFALNLWYVFQCVILYACVHACFFSWSV